MQIKILIIGSTGQLGIKLLKFSKANNIPIDAITCNKNKKLLIKQSKSNKIKNIFHYNNDEENISLIKYISSNKLGIIYFLDHGSGSLNILEKILKFQKGSIIAIANKEMIIAGNTYMINKIKKTHNKFITLDSEHFSLINSNLINSDIENLYITASGGPFYSNKKINLDKVLRKDFLSHPKWKMGNNNLIDSSNFINKILEIFELSIIYNIDIDKIDFLISTPAYIHSIIRYHDNIITINCFNNDMLITLTKPLGSFYKFKLKINKSTIFNRKNYLIEPFNDKRFKIIKYYKKLKKLDHSNQIKFMILNNMAQKKYLDNKLQYNQIVKFIVKNLNFKNSKVNLRSFKEICDYIKFLKKEYNLKNV